MKVLWFTNTPPAAVNGGGKYNGGGWVDAFVCKSCDIVHYH